MGGGRRGKGRRGRGCVVERIETSIRATPNRPQTTTATTTSNTRPPSRTGGAGEGGRGRSRMRERGGGRDGGRVGRRTGGMDVGITVKARRWRGDGEPEREASSVEGDLTEGKRGKGERKPGQRSLLPTHDDKPNAQQRLSGRRASRHVEVDRDDPVATANDRVRVVVVTASVRARTHRDDPAGLGHL